MFSTSARRLALSAGFAAGMALTLYGCGGGGGGGGGGTSTATGEVTLAVTDAPSDDIEKFEVDLVSFRFVRRDGAIVEALPQTARVDLAQLVTVSEVLAAAQLPAGDYLRAFMTVDFATSTCLLTGSTSPAALRDDGGRPLGREELEVVFPNGGFACGPAAGRFAVVDFDLDQSLQVDLATNTVTVDAVLYAEIDPLQPKVTRTTGLALGYTGTTFQLDVRRLLGVVSRGLLRVSTDGATVYDLGGTPLVGPSGFAALEALGSDVLVAVDGVLNPLTRVQTATRVVLLPQNLDACEGLVVARAGGPGVDATLTLRGVSVTRANGGVITFNDQMTLVTSLASTKVGRRGVAAGSLTTDALNVGQRVVCYGLLNGSTMDLSVAGSGFVRLLETGVHGVVAVPPAGGLTLDVARIGARPAAAFDFAVGGVAQADPKALAVSTGGASLGSIVSGSTVTVRGFFPAVEATAQAPDFLADSVIDRTGAGALLRVRWLPASQTAVVAGGGEPVLDLAGTIVHEVDRGFGLRTQLTANPTVAGNATGFYALRRGATITLYLTYSEFRARLDAELAAGRPMALFCALGRFDAPSSRFTASRAFAVVR